MVNSDNFTPEEKLNAAIESFEILTDNLDNFSVREQLELSSKIRDNLSTDKSVTDACNINSTLSEQKKSLLDSIRKFQMCLISENLYKDEEISFSSSHVNEFYKAKAVLAEMIDNELSLNIFEETEEPPIYDSIEESQTHTDTLMRVSSNCKYGKYKVLIMGDFQSGKSTTLDAFCDGRNISAIGKGDATSAVLVSVTYAEKESMTICWKEKNQFSPMFDKIKQYLQDFNWEAFDLDNDIYRKELFDAIENLRKSKNCPNVGEGDSKFLMLCSFVLTYYDSNELREKKKSLVFISEISDVTKFPDKGESLWKKMGVEQFSINDALFVFIDKVECFIPSDTLKELNCTVIDSPGLFNSSYDTMVTENAMKEAHAIMYILPYYKGIGIDVCQSLYTIKNNYSDVHRKLFIVNNLILTNDNAFYESNCKQIESMFGQDKKVYPYDGKLSYLAQLYKLHSSGAALDKDYNHLMRVTARGFGKTQKEKLFGNFADAWNFHTQKYDITDMSFEEIIDQSGFSEMTSALKQFIANNESYAVIISNGLSPMRSELISIENSLFRSYIEPYISSYDDLVELWEKRINIAKEFQEYIKNHAKDTLLNSQEGRESLLERMTEEESTKLFTYDFYTKLTKEVAGVLYDNKGSLLVTKSLFKKDKTKFMKRFSELSFPWIKDKVMDLVNSKMKYLVDNIEREQDKTVENMFAPVIVNLEKEYLEYWKTAFGGDKGVSMKDYLSLNKHLSLSDKSKKSESIYPSDTLSNKDVSGTLLGGLVAEISVLVAGIASMIAGYIAAAFFDPTGISQATVFLGAVVLGLGGMVITIFAPDALRNKFIEILSEKIDTDVRSNAPTGFRNIVKSHLENTFNKYISGLSVNISKLEKERDKALYSNSDQEPLCFRALEANNTIHNQILTYDEYKKLYLKDEAH